MGCFPPSLELRLERLLNRTRCILACCGGQIIVQNSEFCDGKYSERHLLQPPKRRKFFGTEGVFRVAREQGHKKITRKQVKDWLEKQDTYTVHKPARRQYTRNKVIVGGKDDQFQADLVNLSSLSKYNDKYRDLLTVIDILSKFAWAILLKTKTGQEISFLFAHIWELIAHGFQVNCLNPMTYHEDI